MKTLHYTISIDAPKETVWNAMLGHEGYKAWADEFAPGSGSDYEGSWEKGQKIRFGDGKEGMSSMIAENRPYEFVSIKHLGFIKGGVEDTQSAEVRAWAPAFENYSFSEKNGKTEVKVDVEEIPQMEEEFMDDVWPKALAKLKDICEHPMH
jgi:uncharacterized protein YndB with AHSA1/START domain